MSDKDIIYRKAALDASEKIIKDCNPEHFVGHQKFIEYMDNVEIGSFGNWQFANGFNMGLTAAEVAIEKLPSAQPEILACGEGELNVLDTNVADCSDCIKHGGDWDCDHVHCHKGKSAQPHGREKLVRPIDADMAIDAIQKDRETSWKELENDDAEYRNGCDDGYAYSMQIISELPSVERKKGKWISVHDDIFADRYYCSCCKTEPICNDTEYILSNYCPNCGADMRE